MLPSFVFKNPEITTVLFNCLLYTGLYWAWASGIFTDVVSTDYTYLALVNFILIIYCNVTMTIMSWELGRLIKNRYDDNNINESLYYTKFDFVAFITVLLPMIGFLGTVIGLAFLMKSAGGVTIENFAVAVGDGTSTALYPTMTGIVGWLVLSVQRFLLTHSFRLHGLAREL